jgi:hypothetical protein
VLFDAVYFSRFSTAHIDSFVSLGDQFTRA